jgi:hypothetical protein
VRRYGPDYANRLADAGFVVETHKYAEEVGPVTAERCGLDSTEIVHLCRKS